MPLEGHYERQNTPLYKLSSREIKAAAIALVVTVGAMLVVVFATVGDSNPPTAKHCINTEVAGIVGAETISGCGQEAVEKCRHAARFSGARAETIVAECRKQEVPF